MDPWIVIIVDAPSDDVAVIELKLLPFPVINILIFELPEPVKVIAAIALLLPSTYRVITALSEAVIVPAEKVLPLPLSIIFITEVPVWVAVPFQWGEILDVAKLRLLSFCKNSEFKFLGSSIISVVWVN